jgi:hypothetical protein
MEYSGDTYYFTSHDDIDTPESTSIHGSLINVNAKTQRYLPDSARSEIGRLKFSILDVGEAVSDLLNLEQFTNDEGPRGRKVVLYRGFEQLAFADFRKEMTQFTDSVLSYHNGQYDFNCSDKQRQLRKNTFSFPATRLSAAVAEDDTTLQVYTTEGFDAVPHGTSYSYLPSTSVIMFRIKYQDSWEICSATGKTATTLTGVTRGIFGTRARAHALPDDANSDNGVEVEYYPYLELPVAKLIYAILTGKLLNQGGATLPHAYHLGIDEADVPPASFESYPDWYDTSDDTKGLILRFEGGALSETDGKAFLEKEVLSLINAFLLVEPDGTLSLRRKVATLSNSDYSATLNEKLIAKVGKLDHDLDAVSSRFRVRWGYREFGPNNKGFYRERVINDPIAAARFPDSKTKELAFKGLTPARHTTTILRNIFESQRDAVASPPLRLSGVKIMPSIGFDIEVGDVYRVDLSNIRDYQNLTDVSSFDRPMEVQRVTIDQIKDSVVVDFVGSATSATQIGDDDNGSAVVPDAAYISAGTELGTVLSINGSGFTTAGGTLTGGTTTRTRYYYDGDLTISAGHTVSFSGNIEIWVKGHFSILGKLDGKGGGLASSLAGWIGTTRGQGASFVNHSLFTPNIINFTNGPTVFGKVQAVPALAIENDAGVLTGYPADMRGSGGAVGGQSLNGTFDAGTPVAGGFGGAGGGSVVIVSRGMSFGVSGELDVSGNDGSLGGTDDYIHGGAGGGGAAGAVVILIDGSGNSVPIAAGKIVADRGDYPTQGNEPQHGVDFSAQKESTTTRWTGYPGLPAVSQFDSNVRIQYLPVSRTAYADLNEGVNQPSNAAVTPIPGGNEITWDNPEDPTSWDLIEVFASTGSSIDSASKIFEGRGNKAPHMTGNTTRQYYWLRGRIGNRYSDFTPSILVPSTLTGVPLIDATVAATTANWTGVIDDQPTTNAKPQDGAATTVEAETRPDHFEGLIWVDKSTGDYYRSSHVNADIVSPGGDRLVAPNGDVVKSTGTFVKIGSIDVTRLTNTEQVLNTAISILADGSLSGAGGGQVTIFGLGYNGSLEATDNSITFSASVPDNGTGVDGNLHIRDLGSSSYAFYTKESGTWKQVGDVTAQNIAAGIVGQGDLAIVDAADFATQVTGSEKPDNNATKNTGALLSDSFKLANDISGNEVAVSKFIDEWTISRNGSAPITPVAGTEFELDQPGLYLIAVHVGFKVELTKNSANVFAWSAALTPWHKVGGASYAIINPQITARTGGFVPAQLVTNENSFFTSIATTFVYEAENANDRIKFFFGADMKVTTDSMLILSDETAVTFTKLEQVPD